MKCRYCFGGYCGNENIPLAARTCAQLNGPHVAGNQPQEQKCREYLRGHFRYINSQANKKRGASRNN